MPYCSHLDLQLTSDLDAKVWRYMDIPKLFSILVDGELFCGGPGCLDRSREE